MYYLQKCGMSILGRLSCRTETEKFMSRKTTLLALALPLLAMSYARADSQLIVSGTTGVQKFSLGSVGSLKFADSKLLVYANGAEQPTAFAIANLSSIKFGQDTPSSIAAAKKDGKASLRYANGQLSMAGANVSNAALYTVSGQCVLNIGAWDGSPVSTSSLQSGMYIFKADNQTIKFIKR